MAASSTGVRTRSSRSTSTAVARCGADALVLIMQRYSDDEHINVGSGEDLTISELARVVCDVVGFKGEIAHDLSKPDGTPRKLMSAAKIRGLGWQPRIGLEEGIMSVYAAFLEAAVDA